jgi:hypothetical protein
MMTENPPKPLIHVAKIFEEGKNTYLFLRKIPPHEYRWFKYSDMVEESTPQYGVTIEEALREGRRHWKHVFYRNLNCGFRYTLPERDEHGYNALFHQMVASYTSMNGIYFDEELGYTCFVQAASQESKDLWQTLKLAGKLT